MRFPAARGRLPASRATSHVVARRLALVLDSRARPSGLRLPHCLDFLLPLCLVVWNSASLLDSRHVESHRWRAKRAQLDRLFDGCGLAFVLESLGTQADVHSLPQSHEWSGAFCPHADDANTSRVGAAGIRRSYVSLLRATNATPPLHRPRCLLAASARDGGTMHIVGVRIDPQLHGNRRVHVMQKLRRPRRFDTTSHCSVAIGTLCSKRKAACTLQMASATPLLARAQCFIEHIEHTQRPN